MATLTEEQRAALWADFMSSISSRREPLGITKADIRAAVDALDGWLDSNAGSANSALPTAARTALSTAQKAELMKIVITKRYQVGA